MIGVDVGTPKPTIVFVPTAVYALQDDQRIARAFTYESGRRFGKSAYLNSILRQLIGVFMNTETGQIYRTPDTIAAAEQRGEPLAQVSERVAEAVEVGVDVIDNRNRHDRRKAGTHERTVKPFKFKKRT